MLMRIDAPMYSSSVLFRVGRENTDQVAFGRSHSRLGVTVGESICCELGGAVLPQFAPLKPRTLNPVDYGLKRPIPKAEA